MQHPYAELKSEYESWVANVRPLPGRVHEIDQVALRLTRQDNLAHYASVFAKIGVPQVVQATICEREDGNDFTKSPAQGDPWNRVSTHVPRGIGPFKSWEESAIYSWTVCDRLNVLSVPEWTLPYFCFKMEGYNGTGYRAHGLRTPYVVGGTNLQQPGKYTSDGSFDPNHMDAQLGALPVAMRMIELVPSLALGHAIAITAPSIIPAVTPLPATMGGNLTGTKWVQASLNVAMHISPPLMVDGSFGRKTRDAVRSFQQAHGLPDSGFIDNAFCSAMDIALAVARPAT